MVESMLRRSGVRISSERRKHFFAAIYEHTEYKWLTYAEAQAVLQYDSNKTALWELNRRIALEMLK